MMLKRFHCRILLREDFSDVKDWYSSLYFPRTFNSMSGQTRAITNHSLLNLLMAVILNLINYYLVQTSLRNKKVKGSLSDMALH